MKEKYSPRKQNIQKCTTRQIHLITFEQIRIFYHINIKALFVFLSASYWLPWQQLQVNYRFYMP